MKLGREEEEGTKGVMQLASNKENTGFGLKFSVLVIGFGSSIHYL